MTLPSRPLLLAGAMGLAALALGLLPARRAPGPAPAAVLAAPTTPREDRSLPEVAPDPARRREQRRRAALPWGRDPFAEHGAHPDR